MRSRKTLPTAFQKESISDNKPTFALLVRTEVFALILRSTILEADIDAFGNLNWVVRKGIDSSNVSKITQTILQPIANGKKSLRRISRRRRTFLKLPLIIEDSLKKKILFLSAR